MTSRRPSEAQNAPQQTQNEPQEAPGGRKRPPDHGKRERFTVGPPDHGKLKRFTRGRRQVPENSLHHRGATRKRSSFGRAPLKQLLFKIPLSVFSLGRFWAWAGPFTWGLASVSQFYMVERRRRRPKHRKIRGFSTVMAQNTRKLRYFSRFPRFVVKHVVFCLLYTSDAADE